MKLNRVFSVAAFSLLAVAAQAQSSGPEEVFDVFVKALNAGDLQAILSVHSDDAVLVPSAGGPFVKGKQAIEAYYKGLFTNTKSRNVVITPTDFWQRYGDTAVRTSNGQLDIETAKGPSSVYLRNTYIFHKEGAEWKMVNSHISNRTTTSTASSSASAASASK